jgi:hypothetical protein
MKKRRIDAGLVLEYLEDISRTDRISAQKQYPGAEAGAHGQITAGEDIGGRPLGLLRLYYADPHKIP